MNIKFATDKQAYSCGETGVFLQHLRRLLLNDERTASTTHHSMYIVSQRNVPPLTCYNLDVHNPITIIFGRSDTAKVKNKMMLPASPIYCFCITLRNKYPRRQRTGTLCVQHSPTAAALLTSFVLNHAPILPITECIDHKT